MQSLDNISRPHCRHSREMSSAGQIAAMLMPGTLLGYFLGAWSMPALLLAAIGSAVPQPAAAAAETAKPSVTLDAFLAANMPPARYAAIHPLIGSYRDGASAVTLQDVYGTAEPEALRSRIIDDFAAADLIPPVNTSITRDPRAVTVPNWDQTLRMCGPRDIGGPPDAYHRPTRCIDAKDTLDWLLLQIAIRRSVAKDRPFILELPKHGGSYAVNQSVSVPSSLHLRWVPDGQGAYSYVAMVGRSDNGTIFTNMNPYSTYLSPTTVPAMVQDVVFDNPRIDGKNVLGENGISFARGARNNRVIGGEIRNLEFDPIIQGGRAVQCEQGCESLHIEGLTVRHSTFGISSGVIQAHQQYIYAGPGMMQSSMVVRGVTIDDVEIPFSFLNTKLDASADPDRQRVDIDGARITNSGALVRAKVKARNISTFSYPSRGTNDRVWCYDKTALGRLYELTDDYYGPEAAGIFVLQSARNVTIRNVTVINGPEYPKIGGLVRGESGAGIRMSNIVFKAKARAVFNLTGGLTGATSSVVKLQNVTFSKVDASGQFDYAVLAAIDVPVIRSVKDSSGSPTGKCATASNAEKFRHIEWRDVRVNGQTITSAATKVAATSSSPGR